LPFSVEFEYQITAPIRDLALHIKLDTIQGERLFITSDRDDPANYQRYMVRQPGRYLSRCHVPASLLNRGVFIVEVSASIPNVQMLFSEPSVVRFSVDEAGSPGSHWAGDRGGFFRPALAWDILAS
jgi:hypothetical protein